MRIDDIGGKSLELSSKKSKLKKADSLAIDMTDSFNRIEPAQVTPVDPKKAAELKMAYSTDALFRRTTRTPEERWRIDLGKAGKINNYSPVLRDDGIYVNAAGKTSRISYDGKVEWSVNTKTTGFSEPAFDSQGNLYIIGGENLISLDKDGKTRWETKIGEYKKSCSHSPLVAHDNKIYIIDDDHVISCRDTDGNVKWSIKRKEAASCQPFLDQNGILHIEGTGKECQSFKKGHVVVDTRASNPTASIIEEASIFHSVLIDSNSRTYGVKGDKYCAKDGTGRLLWELPLPDDNMSSSQVKGPDGNLYLLIRNHTLMCIDPSGKENWRMKGDQSKEPISNHFAWGDDGTLFVSGDGANWKLYAINPDGSRKWTHSENESVGRIKVGGDGNIYTAEDLSKIKVFSPDKGDKKYEIEEKLAFGDSISVTDRGEIVAVNRDGEMFLFKKKTKGVALEEAQEQLPPRRGQRAPTIVKGDDFIIIGGVKLDVNKD